MFSKLTLILLLVFVTNISSAGGWVIGGGELIEDASNPWFLNNKPTVSYCVLVDEVNFGLSQAKVETFVHRGLQFWMRQFKDSAERHPEFPLGKQVFVQEPCSSATELKFQFGYLDLEQLSNLENVDRKIAVTVRTAYDRVSLRGKGFLYLSPERGPLRVVNPNGIQNQWSFKNGTIAQLVLIHELGHIFGIKHSDSLPLMQEDFVELAVSKAFAEFIDFNQAESDLDNYSLFQIGSSVQDGYTYSYCIGIGEEPGHTAPIIQPKYKKAIKNNGFLYNEERLASFFGLSFVPNCVKQKLVLENGIYSLYLEFSKTKTGDEQVIQLKADSVKDLLSTETTNIFRLFLTKEQKVFSWANVGYNYFGRREVSVTFKTNYVNRVTGMKHPLVVNTTSSTQRATITTVFQGEIFSDFLNGN